jgi:hypothetical protein
MILALKLGCEEQLGRTQNTHSDHSMQMRARNESSLQSYQVAASLSFHNENHVNTIPNPDSELWWTLE